MDTTRNKRFILSGGGTGGHIFPAVAIAKELIHRYGDSTEILFVGAVGKMEMTKVPAAGFRIVGLPVEGLQRSLSLKNISVLIKALVSVFKARSIINNFKPDAVIGTGGYVSLPVCYMASRMQIPVILQEQNGFAGLTNKVVGSRASIVCTGFPAMDKFFPKGNWLFTGNPVRDVIVKTGQAVKNPEQKQELVQEAAKKWGLNPNSSSTLFITGGSLGARTINETILRNLTQLLTSNIQIIWQTGERFWNSHQLEIEAQIKQVHQQGITTPIYVSPFIDSMELAMAAADVIVSRAGAITLSEIAIIGTPAILVPSPNVTDDHQTKNASVFSNAHAASMIKDTDCKERLYTTICDLFIASDKRLEYKQNLQLLSKPNATVSIVDQIDQIINTTRHA
ncbi:MAG: undecaprenyldiphospho-muramoylpentapeptide beta-N-acetylglucosaminyltransferase [Bacteroidota bacterium]|jgi:UDP-N-acetylglucosamine--N-acetylmuramyl-(pentapeptide) pyrophosphoryl-undecaprenol N-acetylglucosamine transferase